MSTPPPMHMPPPPPPPAASAAPGAVPNYLAWAIISTVVGFCLCCPSIIAGIIAIVYSNQVNTKLNAGDAAGAREASDKAKLWCWITTGLAILGLLINLVFFLNGGMHQYMESIQAIQAMQGR